jgi:hypothetical protein
MGTRSHDFATWKLIWNTVKDGANTQQMIHRYLGLNTTHKQLTEL